MISEVLRLNRDELAILERDVATLEACLVEFPRKTHAEIVKELQAMGSDIKDGEDL